MDISRRRSLVLVALEPVDLIRKRVVVRVFAQEGIESLDVEAKRSCSARHGARRGEYHAEVALPRGGPLPDEQCEVSDVLGQHRALLGERVTPDFVVTAVSQMGILLDGGNVMATVP